MLMVHRSLRKLLGIASLPFESWVTWTTIETKAMSIKSQYNPQSVPHPGVELRETLVELGMGPKEFALRTEKPEKTIIAVLNGKSALTPDMAILFEHVLRIPAHYWMERQRQYDEAMARSKGREALKLGSAWCKQFPYAAMQRLGWVPATKDAVKRTEALLHFFGFGSPSAWESYYLEEGLRTSFRLSLVSSKNPHAISAWLRQGEQQAKSMDVGIYDRRAFLDVLHSVKPLVAEHPPNFFEQLQQSCLQAGVRVVYTPCLPKAPINGCARWVADGPLIQLSARYKRNDIFWFSFFHEAGHIVLHGKRDIFVEGVSPELQDLKKESEADTFAAKHLLSAEQQALLLEQMPLNDTELARWADRFGTHPAILVGRLQHLGHWPYSRGHQFFETIDLDAWFGRKDHASARYDA